jgi:hypothetical protein
MPLEKGRAFDVVHCACIGRNEPVSLGDRYPSDPLRSIQISPFGATLRGSDTCDHVLIEINARNGLRRQIYWRQLV